MLRFLTKMNLMDYSFLAVIHDFDFSLYFVLSFAVSDKDETNNNYHFKHIKIHFSFSFKVFYVVVSDQDELNGLQFAGGYP